MRRQQRLLVHHRNAGRVRIRRTLENHRLPPPPHFPAIGGQTAGDNLHQSRFARPVLADQCMHLARGDRELSARKRANRAEIFLDSPEF